MGFHRSDAGMSLVEIMVALFIVGLASGIVILSVPASPDRMERVRQTFREAISEARKTALFSGQPYGFDVDADGITPLVFSKGGWTPVATGRALKFPEGVQVEPVKAEQQTAFQISPDENLLTAEIWFDPAGVTSAVPLLMRWNGMTFEIGIDEHGEVSFSE